MKWMFLFLAPMLLFAENQARLTIGCTVNIDSENVSISFDQLASDNPFPPAAIELISKPAVFDLSYLQKNSYIDASFTLKTICDPSSSSGYTLALNLLTQNITLDVMSSLFQYFRLFSPIYGFVLNAQFLNQTIWLQRVNSETFTTGAQISPYLTNDNLVVSLLPKTISTTLTLRFFSKEILSSTTPSYWMQILAGMDPYTASSDQVSINVSEVSAQLNALNAYVNQIDGYLEDKNSIYRLTDGQKAILNQNKSNLVKEINDIAKANKITL
ncbi:MAG: hypothetical protein FJZ56_07495 [Chlamydiae bacterium]|nr:hypothetical protein [Chlamydiota bacterium]